MQVFVTGASGHIGSAVVPELIGAGHEVIGLARSDEGAAALAAAGAAVQRGNLDDPAAIAGAAGEADGVIHLAYNHEGMSTGDIAGAAALDLALVEAVGTALADSGKPFVITSGTLLLAFAGISGRPGSEADVIAGGPRIDSENAAVAFAERGVRSSVVRLPPIVHSDLDHHGFTAILIETARERGVAGYVGDGSNRWPSVHTLDAARLYRLALEGAPAGRRLHGVADEGVPFREIAEVIGSELGLATASVAPEDAGEHFGMLGLFVGLDNPTSSQLTRELLGWQPTHPGLIEDLQHGHYFDAATAK